MILVLVACGAAATPQAEQPATSAPVATSAPQAAIAPATSGETLEQAAARLAGGPGAIYVGDLSQLVGPAPLAQLGFGEEGVIPLDILEGNEWIYDSDYYKFLLDRANFDNPTKVVTQGENIEIQYACINRSLFPCKAKERELHRNVDKPRVLGNRNCNIRLTCPQQLRLEPPPRRLPPRFRFGPQAAGFLASEVDFSGDGLLNINIGDRHDDVRQLLLGDGRVVTAAGPLNHLIKGKPRPKYTP